MRTFNDNLPCQSVVTIEGTIFKLKKLPITSGNGFSFTVDSPNTEPETIHLPSVTANEEKK
jgi:hypothetical protein